MIFNRRKESEKIFFKLKTNEFFGAHVAQSLGAAGVVFIPGGGNCLSEEVNPASISRRQGKRVSERGRSDVDSSIVQLSKISLVSQIRAKDMRTLMRMSLYRSFCWRRRELVDPTIYDFVP